MTTPQQHPRYWDSHPDIEHGFWDDYPDPDDAEYQETHAVQDRLEWLGHYDDPPICSPAESQWHGDVAQAMDAMYGKGSA